MKYSFTFYKIKILKDFNDENKRDYKNTKNIKLFFVND